MKKLRIVWTLVISAILGTLAFAEEAKQPTYGSVSRLQYRLSFNGESSLGQGMFRLLPYGFWFTEAIDVYTPVGDNRFTNFETLYVESNLGRPFSTLSKVSWGRSFGWVARFQKLSSLDTIWSIGAQWTITDTPGMPNRIGGIPWKTFIQVFSKNRDNKAGRFDIYHWLEIPFMPGSLIFRMTNSYYMIKDRKNYFSTLEDLIFPTSGPFDIYLRHSYQNIDHFFNRSKGSQYALGVRYSY
jgi:hypothetical protein